MFRGRIHRGGQLGDSQSEIGRLPQLTDGCEVCRDRQKLSGTALDAERLRFHGGTLTASETDPGRLGPGKTGKQECGETQTLGQLSPQEDRT